MTGLAARDDDLARWQRCFLGALLAAWVLRGLAWLLDIPDVWSRRGQYVLSVPMAVSAVVVVATRLRRWADRPGRPSGG